MTERAKERNKAMKEATGTSSMIRRPADSDPRWDRIKQLASARGLTLWEYLDLTVGLHEHLLGQSRSGNRAARRLLNDSPLGEVNL